MVSFADNVSERSTRSQTRLAQMDAKAGSVLAFLAQLALHFACFFSNLSTLVVFCWFNELLFFWPLCLTWFLASCFITQAAVRELVTGSNPGFLRRLWVFIVFGVLRGLQVRHILRFFQQRRAASGSVSESAERVQMMEPSPFNSKTFDGILEGFFFALGNQFAYFLLDSSAPSCSWYMARDFDKRCRGCDNLRYLFLFSALFSMLSLAVAVVELDFRVSKDVRWRISSSPTRAFLHFLYRASEVVISMSLINLVCIFLRPQPYMQSFAGPYLLYMPIFILWLLDCLILHSVAKRHGADQEFLLSHVAVAFASITVNPTQFVDRPIYLGAAKSATKIFHVKRGLTFLAMGIFIGASWNTKFPTKPPANCRMAPGAPDSIGSFTIMYKSNHRVAYAELGVALVIHMTVIALQPYVRRVWNINLGLCASGSWQEQEPRAFLATSQSDSLQAEVRRSVPKGLSSFLVQAGTGVTSRLFANKEFEVTDFCIEKVLGRGAYGVVVLVKAMWRGGEPLPDSRQRLFALKLQNVSDYWRATYADREREYLLKLNKHNHPFIMRLESFMEVPEDHEFQDVDGCPIQDGSRQSRFHKALMMEYCPQGDLESYLQERALVASGPATPPPDHAETLENSLRWLDTARRFSAQLVEAVRFLHQEEFSHRDLKPANVLLKRSEHGLDVCITDFGFAKQYQGGQELHSVAGDQDYMAPEIRETRDSGLWIGEVYTSAVDLWSLGRMILVMLWDAKFRYGGMSPEFCAWNLQTPKAEWYSGEWGHPRIPPVARSLVGQMMERSAHLRGPASALVRHPFFLAFEHRGQHFPACDYTCGRAH